MQYKYIAKYAIRKYVELIVEKGIEFDSYDEYKEIFYNVISDVLRIKHTINSKLVKTIAKDYKKALGSEFINQIKGSKDISYNVVKAMFDIVIKELKEESGNDYGNV